ncbi:MAG: formate/nitrite transporter family protein, partial [Candidatus Adiutrix sp.]
MSVIKTPVECMDTVCTIGGGRPSMSITTNLIMAFFAGAYIAIGSLLAIKVVANMPIDQWGNLTRLIMGGVFPVGLLLVLLAGADLFTGDCMYMPAAVMKKKASWYGLFRNWTLAYSGNLIGSIFVVYVFG